MSLGVWKDLERLGWRDNELELRQSVETNFGQTEISDVVSNEPVNILSKFVMTNDAGSGKRPGDDGVCVQIFLQGS